METITIPYSPRFPQNEIHPKIEKHRFSVLVAHRRLGKTVLAINHIIKMAIKNNQLAPRYAYIAPYLKQSKLIAWDYLKRFTEPIPGIKTNESDLIVELPNGARIYLFGADNPDALRGTYLDGVVLDEYAQIRPEVFSEIIRPALSDRNGWAVFLGTPKGQNQFFEIYNHAIKEMAKGDYTWWAGLYRGDETNVIPQQEMDELRSILSDSTYRQEILCDFTAASDNVLIPIDLVSTACKRRYEINHLHYQATILGVDPARFGDDKSVIIRRNGLQCDEPITFKGMDNMALVGRLSKLCDECNPDAVFIDAGAGAGVIDRMRQLGYEVFEVNFGGTAIDSHYVNKRTEMWDKVRDWLTQGGALPNSPELKTDLVVPTYDFDAQNRMRLEPKDKIKQRLGRSPDCGDALALTFAMPVRNKADVASRLPRQAIR